MRKALLLTILLFALVGIVHGQTIEPSDIEVEFDPQAWRAGRDPQLEKAVEVVMEALKKNPLPKPRKPAYPNYHNGRSTTSGGQATEETRRSGN